MSYVVVCPMCGHRAPWTPLDRAVVVRCVAPRITRQIRRQAERDKIDPAKIAGPCGFQFTVRAVEGAA